MFFAPVHPGATHPARRHRFTPFRDEKSGMPEWWVRPATSDLDIKLHFSERKRANEQDSSLRHDAGRFSAKFQRLGLQTGVFCACGDLWFLSLLDLRNTECHSVRGTTSLFIRNLSPCVFLCGFSFPRRNSIFARSPAFLVRRNAHFRSNRQP